GGPRPSQRALRRPAAACGDRPGAGRRPLAGARRRAYGKPRQPDQPRHRRSHAPAQSGRRHHLRLLHPRLPHPGSRRPHPRDRGRSASTLGGLNVRATARTEQWPPFSRAVLAALAVSLALAGPARAQSKNPLVNQGRDLLNNDKIDEALAVLEKAAASDPADPYALAWFGAAQTRKAATVDIFDGPQWVMNGFKSLDEAVKRFPDAYIGY